MDKIHLSNMKCCHGIHSLPLIQQPSNMLVMQIKRTFIDYNSQICNSQLCKAPLILLGWSTNSIFHIKEMLKISN